MTVEVNTKVVFAAFFNLVRVCLSRFAVDSVECIVRYKYTLFN